MRIASKKPYSKLELEEIDQNLIKINIRVVKNVLGYIDPITKMSAPQSLIKLQRFLGMLNYFGKSISNIAHFKYCCATRSTFEKDVVFSLQKPQKNSINFD